MSTTQRDRMLAAPAGRELRLSELRDIEVRAAEGDGPIGFKGIAAVFDTRAKIGSSMWGWFEEIRAGAFEQSIDEDDIRMLKNHNTDLVLARNKADNLRLEEVEKGLSTDADMTPTTYAVDLALSLDAGDVSQMSFGFEIKEEEWITLDDDDPDKGKVVEPELRVIKRVKLWEVSPVTFPAYTDTEAGLRVADIDVLGQRFAIEGDALEKVAAEIRAGNADVALVRALATRPGAKAPAIAPKAPTTEPRSESRSERTLRDRAADLFPTVFAK